MLGGAEEKHDVTNVRIFFKSRLLVIKQCVNKTNCMSYICCEKVMISEVDFMF
jgi:hypothetical protein